MLDKVVRKRIRIPDFDYSQEGVYFITICANKRKSLFGRVTGGDVFHPPSVVLSDLGKIVRDNIPRICSTYTGVFVDHYIIMPNHIHMLLRITGDACSPNGTRDKMLVPKILQSYKASVSRQASTKYAPVWQSRYYDHVVRNEQDYLRIWEYIECNAAKWTQDEYYSP